MGGNGADGIAKVEADTSETTIEIKIKTLDSQTYTLRVDKQMPVPALKEQIALVTGVLSEQQRLICRGKVLKDDQLLSAYHVEDGHTLHMVVRQPVPASLDASQDHSDPASSTSYAQHTHVTPRIVVETFNVPDQGDGVLPDISRIVSAVLGSFGIHGSGSGSARADIREQGPGRNGRTSSAGGVTDSPQAPPEQSSVRGQSDGAFQFPTSVSLGPMQPLVIPDSMTTISQYLSSLRQELDASGRGWENNGQSAAAPRTEEREANSVSGSETVQGLPTASTLADVMLSTRQMLVEQVGDSLLQLATQLQNQGNEADPAVRLSTQSSAWRTGVLFQNLGSLLLELGRTTMTLRLGRTPSEAVVNAGPAVFISPSGPNPLMVQPLPFQPGTSFGAIPTGSAPPGLGSVGGLGAGFLSRRIDIQIRRGSQQHSGQTNESANSGGENPTNQATPGVSEASAFSSESGVRVLPIRAMVAAVPGSLGRLPADSSAGAFGLYYPVVGGMEHVTSMQFSSGRGSQASDRTQLGQHLHSESALQPQNQGDLARDVNSTTAPALLGPYSTPHLRNQEQGPPNPRGVSSNIMSNGRTQNHPEFERQIQDGALQFLRTLFPGGEFHEVRTGFEEAPAGSATNNAGTQGSAVNSQQAEPTVSDEGLFLSNLLHQIMPLICEEVGTEPNNSGSGRSHQSSARAEENSEVGTSCRQRDHQPDQPNSKRQKRE